MNARARVAEPLGTNGAKHLDRAALLTRSDLGFRRYRAARLAAGSSQGGPHASDPAAVPATRVRGAGPSDGTHSGRHRLYQRRSLLLQVRLRNIEIRQRPRN